MDDVSDFCELANFLSFTSCMVWIRDSLDRPKFLSFLFLVLPVILELLIVCIYLVEGVSYKLLLNFRLIPSRLPLLRGYI
jgi:hypothetical protein